MGAVSQKDFMYIPFLLGKQGVLKCFAFHADVQEFCNKDLLIGSTRQWLFLTKIVFNKIQYLKDCKTFSRLKRNTCGYSTSMWSTPLVFGGGGGV